jgi:hypothetical protein
MSRAGQVESMRRPRRTACGNSWRGSGRAGPVGATGCDQLQAVDGDRPEQGERAVEQVGRGVARPDGHGPLQHDGPRSPVRRCCSCTTSRPGTRGSTAARDRSPGCRRPGRSPDLTLGVYEPAGDGPVPAEVTCAADLFDHGAAQRIARELLTALAAAVADPHRRLSAIAADIAESDRPALPQPAGADGRAFG